MQQEKKDQSKLFNCFLYGFAIIGIFSTLAIFVLGGFGYYLWQTDYFGVKDFFDNGFETPTSTLQAPTIEDGKLQLTPTQERMLRAAGMDPDKLQQKEIQELDQCASNQLGVERYQQIKTGQASPSYSDFQKLKPCAE